MNGICCPACTPAAVAGHPEPPRPDPERSAAGLMRAHGANVIPLPTGDAREHHARASSRAGTRTDTARGESAHMGGQVARLYELMKDGRPYTLEQMHQATGGAATSTSARFRDLWNVHHIPTDRKDLAGGQSLYRITHPDPIPEGHAHPDFPSAVAGQERPKDAWTGAREPVPA